MKKTMYYMAGIIIVLSICVGLQLKTTWRTTGKHHFKVQRYWIEPEGGYRWTVWHKDIWYVWSKTNRDDLVKEKKHFVTLAGKEPDYNGPADQADYLANKARKVYDNIKLLPQGLPAEKEMW